MSYSKTIFKKFIKSEIKRANSLNEKLTTGQTLGIDSDNVENSKRLQTYKEKWGFDRASTDSPWLRMFGFAAPVEDLWNNFFGDGGWFTTELGGFTALGNSVISGFSEAAPGHRGQQWQERTSNFFPRTSGILSSPGRYVTSFGAPTSQSIFADPAATAAAGYPVTNLGVPIREQAEDSEGESANMANNDQAFSQFSASINQDLHAMVSATERIRSAPDAVSALEMFNDLAGHSQDLSQLRRDFRTATDTDLDKQALKDSFADSAVPQFISHVMDVGVEDLISNLELDGRQVGEIQNLLANAKMRL